MQILQFVKHPLLVQWWQWSLDQMLTNSDVTNDEENHRMRFLVDCQHLEGREAAKPPPESAARYILSCFLKDTGFPSGGSFVIFVTYIDATIHIWCVFPQRQQFKKKLFYPDDGFEKRMADPNWPTRSRQRHFKTKWKRLLWRQRKETNSIKS